jgi:GGDEF domain-containing protein
VTAVFITDPSGEILFTSRDSQLGERGQPGLSLRALMHPDDYDPAMLTALASGRVARIQLECRLAGDEGEVRQGLFFGSRLSEPGSDDLLLFAMQDVTRERVGAEIAAISSFQDEDSGLPSRALHDNRLRHALDSAAEEGVATGVLRVHVASLATDQAGSDVDRRQAGKDAATALVAALPASATITRFGAAEFSVVLPRLRKPERELAAVAEAIAAALGAWARPSIGGTYAFGGEGVDAGELIRRSALAVYAGEPVRPAPHRRRRGWWLGRWGRALAIARARLRAG